MEHCFEYKIDSNSTRLILVLILPNNSQCMVTGLNRRGQHSEKYAFELKAEGKKKLIVTYSCR